MSNLGRISVVNKDYDAMRQALVDRIPLITDRWTDFNASDLGMTLLELFCGIGDMLAYYLDKQANETYLPTVKQRQNLINLCKLIGYKLSAPVPSQTQVQFTLTNGVLDENLVIPSWTVVKTAHATDSIPFALPEAGTIPAGQLSVIANAIQARRYTDTFIATGEPDQRFELRKSPVAQSIPKNIHLWPQALSTVEVSIGGIGWQEVVSWYDSDDGSEHFQVETDGNDTTSLVFGDGFFGLVPPSGAEITVTYLVTFGSKGNVRKGAVTKLEGCLTLGGQIVPVSVTNIDQATGGADRETTARARKLAPASLRSIWKLVTKKDYESEILENFPSVEAVEVLDANDCENIPYLRVYLLIHPVGGGPLSPLLREQIQAFVEERKVLTTEVAIYDQSTVPEGLSGGTE